jgi:hypothetical protein
MSFQLIQQRQQRPSVRWMALVLSFLCLLLTVLTPGAAIAGKEGVFINGSVYFTLEEAAIAKGADYQTLRFQVKLNNDGGAAVNFNAFGIRVTSASGGSYYAELTQKGEGIVRPYTAAAYFYSAVVPAGEPLDQLHVTVFQRGGGELGSLSVANVENLQSNEQQLLLALQEIDEAASDSASVSFQAVKGQAVPQNGQWLVTVDLAVTPTGTDTVTLPSALQFYLRDASGYAHPMTAKSLSGTALSAGQSSHYLLSAALNEQPSAESLTLELAKQTAADDPLGRLSLASIFLLGQQGEKVAYPMDGRQGVQLEVQKAEELMQSGKRQALITAVLHNDSKRTLQAPVLSGTIVSTLDEMMLKTDAVLKPDTYLAPGTSGTYKFALELPDGIQTESLQFLVSEDITTTASGTGTTASAQTASVPVAGITLSGLTAATTGLEQLPAYELGKPLAFDTNNEVIDPKLEVSVVELTGHTNTENGYQTVVAKFKFLNRSGQTLALPAFATELTDAYGTSYPGSRQTTSLQQLIPNSAYVYSYSYLLPPSSEGPYKLSILDQSATTKYKVAIADYLVKVDGAGSLSTDPQPVLSFYPYQIKLESWSLSSQYSSGTYSYKLKLGLDIKKEDQVITDASFSTMEFEVVDTNGRALGSSSQVLQGTNKLVNGLQTISFTNIKSEQFEYPLTVRVYESIVTPSGTVKRLVAELKQ